MTPAYDETSWVLSRREGDDYVPVEDARDVAALVPDLALLCADLVDYVVELIDDEWGKQERPYTGSFEKLEDLLARLEGLGA